MTIKAQKKIGKHEEIKQHQRPTKRNEKDDRNERKGTKKKFAT